MEKLVKRIKFYFSISNLACDNVLLNKLLYEKCVSIDFLLTFNKIKHLLYESDNPREELIKACSQIPELNVEQDGIHLRTSITKAFIEQYRNDSIERTIYFENISDEANHKEIKNLFKEFGEILYISLPRFKETQILKGFGFLEFSNRLSCEAAVFQINLRVSENSKYESMKVMQKHKWIQYKEKLQTLKKRLRFGSPEREYSIIVKDLPECITLTQIMNMLDIKPFKIEFKSGNNYAILKYVNTKDKQNILKCQPSLLGKPVRYYENIN